MNEMGILKYGAEAQGMKMQRSQTENSKILDPPPAPHSPQPAFPRAPCFSFPSRRMLIPFNIIKSPSSAGRSSKKMGPLRPGSRNLNQDPYGIPGGSHTDPNSYSDKRPPLLATSFSALRRNARRDGRAGAGRQSKTPHCTRCPSAK